MHATSPALLLKRLLPLALLAAGPASAAVVFNFEGNGPVARAMGGTGVAYDNGAAGLMYNPATLGLAAAGGELHLGLDWISADIEVRNRSTGERALSTDNGKNRGPYFAPQLGLVRRDGRLSFGLGLFAGSGGGDELGNRSFLSRTETFGIDTGLDNSARLFGLRLPLGLSWRVDERLTLGGSIDAVHTALNFNALFDLSQIGALAADGRVSGTLLPTLLLVPGLAGAHVSFTQRTVAGGGAEAWGVGGRVGLTYALSADTRLGLAYNFRTANADLDGRGAITAISAIVGQIPLQGDVRVRDFEYPAQLSLGLHQRLGSQWSVAADYQRVYWKAAVRNLDLHFAEAGSGNTVDISLPQNYRDIGIYAVGLSYAPGGRYTLRVGAQHADRALPRDTMLAVIPAIVRSHVAAGLSWRLDDRNRIDFAFSHGLRSTLGNDSPPNTARPIEASHSQANAVLSYVRRL
ncbi:MAG: outer membrane protein transport protein [Sinimarinibacterium sp.]|jgi:long-chain fatty acid transport protein